VRGQPATANRPETIEETAEQVSAWGGVGIPVQVDHTEVEQVTALVERVKTEQGKLDILVNDIWGGDALTEWGTAFWQHSLSNGLLMQQRGVHSHLITSWCAVPLLIAQGQGLIIEITDGDHLGYRGNFFYDLAKVSVIRAAYGLSKELQPHHITVIAVTPGFLRSEAMLDHFGVTETNWQEGARQDPHFIASETPFYLGRGIAALAADPGVARHTGKVLSSWNLAKQYGFTDIDGRKPDWGAYFAENIPDYLTHLDSYPFGVKLNGSTWEHS
jgi:NAD(P)-dependent dehydrogenase (short-subunit alcohol dehydrogenase family)